jgi:transposase-like protein
MKDKSQVILGLKRPSEFSLEERKRIIEEWLNSGNTKRDIWRKYTGENIEHGNLVKWMRQLGYNFPKKWTKLDNSNSSNMVKSKCNSSVEFLQMQEKIKELEKALVNSELRATAYETMIEIAEKELKINIRKKSNTKPSIR